MDDPVQIYLATRKPGTRAIYSYGLKEFQQFYQSQGTTSQFIDRVQQDLKVTDWKEKGMVAQNSLKAFSEHLQAKGLAPTSVRSYVASVQGMLKHYLGITIALFPGTMPAPVILSETYPWTLQTVTQFIESMTDPMYQSLSTLTFQSGLGMYEAIHLTYGDIKEEYENNMTPLCLDFRIKTRKKTSYPFLTFIGTWAIDKLHTYLNTKTLTPDLQLYPVIKEQVDHYFRTTAKPFLGHWKGRNPMRFHSLRTAFKTICTDANVIGRPYVEYFMSHSKPGKKVEESYISKSRDSWCEIYRKIEPYLTPKSTAIPAGTPEQPF